MMRPSLSQNNTGGSVEAAPPTHKTPQILSGRYFHKLWSGSATTHEDQMDEDNTAASDERKYNAYDGRSVGETLEIIPVAQGLGETLSDIRDIDTAKAEAGFQRPRSLVSVALATLAKHCPPQLRRQAKTKRQYSSLEQENSPKIARKRRRLIGWGRSRQEDDLLSWLTHALVPSDMQLSDGPSDVHTQDNNIAEDLCDSEVRDASLLSVSHVSVDRPQAACGVPLASIPEERWSYWLTRPLCRTRTSDTLAQGDLQPSPPDHSRTPPIPAVQFSSAYASCFANPQRQPSVIRWKLS